MCRYRPTFIFVDIVERLHFYVIAWEHRLARWVELVDRDLVGFKALLSYEIERIVLVEVIREIEWLAVVLDFAFLVRVEIMI